CCPFRREPLAMERQASEKSRSWRRESSSGLPTYRIGNGGEKTTGTRQRFMGKLWLFRGLRSTSSVADRASGGLIRRTGVLWPREPGLPTADDAADRM